MRGDTGGAPHDPRDGAGSRDAARPGAAFLAALLAAVAGVLGAGAAGAQQTGQPCDFLPLGIQGATIDAQGPDTPAQCTADLLIGERSATAEDFVGVFSVTILHETWGDIVGVYRSIAEGGSAIDLGDEGVFKVTPSAAAGGSGTDVYGAYFLKGPYSVAVEHTVMDPDFFREDTDRTRTLTELLARAIDDAMDDAGVGGAPLPPQGAPPAAPPVAASDDGDGGGGVPIGPIAGVTVVLIGGAAVTINVLRRRPPARPPRPAQPGDVPRCWGEVAALDDAGRRLEQERDDLRSARDHARERIGAIERALDAERTLGDAFAGYVDAVRSTQGVHTARVYSQTAIIVSATFAAGAASIEMLNALFGIEAAAMAPEAATVAGQLEQGVQAARTAAQAAARLPELQSRLLSAQRLASAARTAELAQAAGSQVAALEQAVAGAQSAIRAGAAAADAAPGLAARLAQLTGRTFLGDVWARLRGVGTLLVDLAGNAAVDASEAAGRALGRDAPERQQRLFDEAMRAADVQRDLAERARTIAGELRQELAGLRADVERAAGLVTAAEAKIADVAGRRAAKAAECERLAAAAAAAVPGGG